jgi:hypothetical protein
MNAKESLRWLKAAFWGCGLACVLASTGCQVDINGQTLPSAYWMKDDVQYFAAGPEFKLSREANELRAYRAQQELEAVTP